MKEDEKLCVSELKEAIDVVAKEVGCDGKSIGSHKIRSSVSAYCAELDQWFDIIDIDPDRLWGCGCWSGLTINLKKDDS